MLGVSHVHVHVNNEKARALLSHYILMAQTSIVLTTEILQQMYMDERSERQTQELVAFELETRAHRQLARVLKLHDV